MRTEDDTVWDVLGILCIFFHVFQAFVFFTLHLFDHEYGDDKKNISAQIVYTGNCFLKVYKLIDFY